MKHKLQKPLSKFSPKMLIILVVPLVAFGVYTLLSSKAAVITISVPTEITCPDRLAGKCRPYPDTSPWNTIIPSNVIEDSKSQTYIDAIKAVGKPLSSRVDQYSIPVWISNSTTPTQNLYMVRQYATYGANDNTSSIVHWRNHGVSWPTQPKDLDCNTVPGDIGPTWPNFPIPANMVPSDGTDSHAVVWNTSTGVEYGLWRMSTAAGYSSSTPPGFPSVVRTIPCKDPAQGTGIAPPFAVPAGINWTAWDGWAYNTNSPANYGTCKSESCGRASNSPLLAGLVRRWEIDQGKIEHAIAFAYTNPSVDSSQHGRYPAVGTVYNTAGTTNDIPFGGRMQLRPDISDDTIQNTWGCKQACFTIAKALQKYGMYATDSSGSSKIFVEDNRSAQWSTASAGSDAAQVYQDTSFNGPGYSLLNKIPWDSFRVVAQPCDPSTLDCSAFVTPASASGPTANLWVDNNTSLTHSCGRSSNPEDYTTASSQANHRTCSNLNDAWQSANPGDKVIIKSSPSSYGNQSFLTRANGAMSSPGVTFNAEPGVKLGSVYFGQDGLFCGNGAYKQVVDWITLKADVATPMIADYLCFGGASNVTIDGIKIDKNWAQEKAAFFAGGPANHPQKDITIRNADFSRVTNEKIMESQCNNASGYPCPAVTNLTIEDSKIHDMRRVAIPPSANNPQGTPANEVHNECFLASAVPGFTLRRTHWYGCTVMNFNFGSFGDSSSTSQTNFHFVNNIFESPTDLTENDKTNFPWFQGCNIPAPLTKPGWVIEYNIFETAWYGQSGCGDQGALLRSNIGSRGLSCPTNATFIKNIWKEGTCGGASSSDILNSTILSSSNFTNIGAHNWTYPAGAFQVDRGDTSTNCSANGNLGGTVPCYPTTDILGTTRPQGSAPDAGAYEYISSGGTTKPRDVNGDGSVNITDISALLSAYGQTGSSLAADLDKNGSVNIADLSIILTNYGK